MGRNSCHPIRSKLDLTADSCVRPPEGVMIDLGERWAAEDRNVFHSCAPDVRTPWMGEALSCACGALVPRRVQKFREWLATADRGDLDSLLAGDEPGFD
jgi:hypothetical protein